MTYLDPASGIQVIEVLPMINMPNGTLSPSYSAPTFTRAFDARPFMSALIVVVAEEFQGDASGVIVLQTTPEETAKGDFNDFQDATTTTGAKAQFDAITSANDNQCHYATVDFKRAQNALGVKLTVTSTGGSRGRVGVYAICFPYNTGNIDITKQFAV